MVKLLLNLVSGTVLVFALVRALTPRTARESVHDHRLRRAQWATVAFAVPLGYLTLLCALALRVGGVPDPRGMIAYVLLLGIAAAAVPVLRSTWRAARAARRAADEDARRAAGLPDPDATACPPDPHRGLSGKDVPPTRW